MRQPACGRAAAFPEQAGFARAGRDEGGGVLTSELAWAPALSRVWATANDGGPADAHRLARHRLVLSINRRMVPHSRTVAERA